MKKVLITGFALLFFVLFVTDSSIAQKLPKLQKAGVWTPDDIKVDGKLTEWKGQFQTYNPVNLIYYTLSNDAHNLYLIIHTSDRYAINKIGVGGVIFTVSASLNKKLREQPLNTISIRYPVIKLTEPSEIGVNARRYREGENDATLSKQQLDSLVVLNNKRLTGMYKEVGVKGIRSDQESIVSIYNGEGIRAMALFDDKMAYTYELAIPLKYLEISIDAVKSFSYNIKLKGTPSNEDWLKINKFAPPSISRMDGGVDFEYQYLNSPTDFWGIYSLVKP